MMETNYPRDYPTDVLPEDRKQERIVELERKLKQAEAQLEEAKAEIKRLNNAKIIPLGEGIVLIGAGREKGKELENEVLIWKAPRKPAYLGEPYEDCKGIEMETEDPLLFVRFVVTDPAGAQVLIDMLRTVQKDVAAALERLEVGK